MDKSSNRVSSAAKNAVINYVGSRLLSEQAGINAVTLFCGVVPDIEMLQYTKDCFDSLRINLGEFKRLQTFFDALLSIHKKDINAALATDEQVYRFENDNATAIFCIDNTDKDKPMLLFAFADYLANKLFKINDKTNVVLSVRLLMPIKTDAKKLTAKTIVDLLKQEIETNEVEFAIM